MKHSNFLNANDCTEDVLACLPEYWDRPLESYGQCLRAAFNAYEPVFTKEHYADFYLKCSVQEPAWIPSNILANAKKESDGSQLLYEFWRRVHGHEELESDIMFHTKDEIRHSKLFLTLAELAFPQINEQSFIAELRKSLFALNELDAEKVAEDLSQEDMADHLVQMNLGEIRTRIHISMIAPLVSALSPAETRLKVEKLLASLVNDETKHIAYTAKHLERMSEELGTNFLQCLFIKRTQDLHNHTVAETKGALYAYAPEIAISFQ